MAGPVGLDYTAVETVMRIHGVADQRTCLEQVRVMESAALEAINEQR